MVIVSDFQTKIQFQKSKMGERTSLLPEIRPVPEKGKTRKLVAITQDNLQNCRCHLVSINRKTFDSGIDYR